MKNSFVLTADATYPFDVHQIADLVVGVHERNKTTLFGIEQQRFEMIEIYMSVGIEIHIRHGDHVHFYIPLQCAENSFVLCPRADKMFDACVENAAVNGKIVCFGT